MKWLANVWCKTCVICPSGNSIPARSIASRNAITGRAPTMRHGPARTPPAPSLTLSRPPLGTCACLAARKGSQARSAARSLKPKLQNRALTARKQRFLTAVHNGFSDEIKQRGFN